MERSNDKRDNCLLFEKDGGIWVEHHCGSSVWTERIADAS